MNVNDRTLQASQHKVFNEQLSEGETLKYTINYSPVIGSATISASTWSGAGLTFTNKGNTTTTAYTTIHGTPGRYTAINLVTTSGSEILERIINLHITSNTTTPQEGDY